MKDYFPKNFIDRFSDRTVLWYPTLDSTNEEAVRLITAGKAAHGTAVIAGAQTSGRGRNGRVFLSPDEKGLYLSLLLCPDCPPEELPLITPMAAVTVCEALERSAGISPGIKWPNDVVCAGKKLCGILTEARMDNGRFWVILGIGLNLTHAASDFGPELAEKAVSLSLIAGSTPIQSAAEEVIRKLFDLADSFPRGREAALAAYTSRCVNLRQHVLLLTKDNPLPAFCTGINRDFSLQVRLSDGTEQTVSSGEVSVRGIHGYI